ncbi:hypothetical protein ILYODFUR_030890 [Ilyodon furcidens]|uniref:Secreted protein n=1 Tax=Ilyodon furcidens TaxID=33524 RepID=A0ABV0T353_9TELE
MVWLIVVCTCLCQAGHNSQSSLLLAATSLVSEGTKCVQVVHLDADLCVLLGDACTPIQRTLRDAHLEHKCLSSPPLQTWLKAIMTVSELAFFVDDLEAV